MSSADPPLFSQCASCRPLSHAREGCILASPLVTSMWSRPSTPRLQSTHLGPGCTHDASECGLGRIHQVCCVCKASLSRSKMVYRSIMSERDVVCSVDTHTHTATHIVASSRLDAHPLFCCNESRRVHRPLWPVYTLVRNRRCLMIRGGVVLFANFKRVCTMKRCCTSWLASTRWVITPARWVTHSVDGCSYPSRHDPASTHAERAVLPLPP